MLAGNTLCACGAQQGPEPDQETQEISGKEQNKTDTVAEDEELRVQKLLEILEKRLRSKNTRRSDSLLLSTADNFKTSRHFQYYPFEHDVRKGKQNSKVSISHVREKRA